MIKYGIIRKSWQFFSFLDLECYLYDSKGTWAQRIEVSSVANSISSEMSTVPHSLHTRSRDPSVIM